MTCNNRTNIHILKHWRRPGEEGGPCPHLIGAPPEVVTRSNCSDWSSGAQLTSHTPTEPGGRGALPSSSVLAEPGRNPPSTLIHATCSINTFLATHLYQLCHTKSPAAFRFKPWNPFDHSKCSFNSSRLVTLPKEPHFVLVCVLFLTRIVERRH